MSISLIRVKGPSEDEFVEQHSNQEIPISPPVVLGRGSLLKCGEKRVSRRHAYLDWDDDGVLITSVHQSPTYIMVSGEKEKLTEGSSKLLAHGDKFGLMKTNFWFKINIPSATLKGNEKKEAEILHNEEISCKEPTQTGKKMKKDNDSTADKNVKNNMYQSRERDVDSDSVQNSGTQGVPSEQEKTENSHNNLDPKEEDTSLKMKKPVTENIAQDHPSCNEGEVAYSKVTPEEIEAAVSTRKRDLPTWMVNCDVSKDKGCPREDTYLLTRGGRQKTCSTPSRRKRADDSNLSVASQTNKNTTHINHLSTSPATRGSSKLNDVEGTTKNKNFETNCVTPKKKKNKLSQGKGVGSPKKAVSPRKLGTRIHHDISEESNDDLPITVTTVREKKKNSPDKTNQIPAKNHSSNSPSKAHDVSEDEEDNLIDESTNSSFSAEANSSAPPTTSTVAETAVPKRKKAPRKSCQYGGKCYRKNQKHREDFAHEGDSDYNKNLSDPEDSDDELPQCEFGVNCYRRNSRHRRDFRHSRVPQPQRRVKRKARQQQYEGGSESDDYDYDDPFLNEGSSDDYAPTDSGSDSAMEAEQGEEEDTTRMLKEAKKFVRKK
ncbi:aprataxin and PNK-like factor isoform X2 [Homarus americanus]|nr:aprataxin and PNK-like factor isoform X2 [Homarus americanus]XP_042204698.1 aprataxin and PNK-like factor isoform X2 [Homarus americanus]XP_042204700.1 aprataxin and PNK-like factor isoform X2 [Homarus americanus]XP_042204701.1 aprataxin and PNK-like factor isoform X2 [Homarus americanus]XP_042204702.1 aprataxin and PNK-like factor isoform X2 [Homarus americanus]XP_042204703.1 aprataxin and PNK-like factor isoform X2 [Homarus americanus]